MLKSIAFRIVRVLLFFIASIFITSVAQLAKSKATQAKYISVEVDRTDKKYLNDETAYFKVSLLNKPANGVLSLEVEAYYFEGSTKKNLNKLGDSSGSASRYSIGTTQNLTATFDAYLVDKKQRESIAQVIAKKTKQVSDLGDLIASNPDPDLIWRKETLEADLVILNQKLAKTRTLVQSEQTLVETIPNDLQLEIFSPTENAILADDSVTVIGKFVSTVPGLKLFVDNEEVVGAVSGVNFSSKILEPSIGYSRVKVEVRRGNRELLSRFVTYGYVPESSVMTSLGEGGGVVEVTSSSSPVAGAAIEIPQGAIVGGSRNFIISDESSSEVVPVGYIEVGDRFSLSPFLMYFQKNVSVKVPVKTSMLPSGRTINDVVVLAIVDGVWKELPVENRGTDSVSFLTNEFVYGAILPVVLKDLESDELRIVTNVKDASIYIDGELQVTAGSSVIQGVAVGEHRIRITSDEHKDLVSTFTFTSPTTLSYVLEPGVTERPKLNYLESYKDRTVDTDSIVITGTVAISNSTVEGKLKYSCGGIELETDVEQDGKFKFLVPLNKGENLINLSFTSKEGASVQDQIKITKIVASLGDGLPILGGEIYGVVTWDSPPEYSVKIHGNLWDDIGIIAGDADTVENPPDYNPYDGIDWSGKGIKGGGPIHFRVLNPKSITYKLNLTYHWANTSDIPTLVTVRIYSNRGISKTVTKLMHYNDSELSVEYTPLNLPTELKIVDVEGLKPSIPEPIGDLCKRMGKSCKTARFVATDADENQILIKVNKPSGVVDRDVGFQIREYYTNKVIPSAPLVNGVAKITIPAFAATEYGKNAFHNKMPPKTLEIVATAKGVASERFFVVQDKRSQWRQEYIDLKAFLPTTKLDQKDAYIRVPAYDEVMDGSKFRKSGVYSYLDFLKDSDFIKWKLGLIGEVVSYAETMNLKYKQATGQKTNLRLTSAYRNPRNNWKLASAKTSGHQYGWSADFGAPNYIKNAKTLTRDKDFRQWLKDFCEFTADTIKGNIMVMVHGKIGEEDHVHLEYQKNRSINCSSFVP